MSTTVTIAEEAVTVEIVSGLSQAQIDASITAHSVLTTVHGLTANISAALFAAQSPAADRPFITGINHGLGIYAPTGWGTNWRAALAASASSLATVAIVGDSIGRGYWTSHLASKSFGGLLRVALQAAHGDGGSGYQGVYDTTLYAAGMPVAERVALTETWSKGGSMDGPAGTYILGPNPGVAASATFSVRGTVVRIYYLSIVTSGGHFTYSIDGATPVNINTNEASAIRVITVSGLSAGTHAVVLTQVSFAVAICGVAGENTAGVVINNYAVSSTTSAQMVNASPIYGHPAAWSGGVSYPADLVIYEYGVNDSNTSVAADTYVANVKKYLDQVRPPATGGARKTDVLFLLPHIGKFTSTLYPVYAEKLRGLAESYGAAIVNLWPRWGNVWNEFDAVDGWSDDTLTGLPGSSQVHPSDIGHQLYYDAISKLIIG